MHWRNVGEDFCQSRDSARKSSGSLRPFKKGRHPVAHLSDSAVSGEVLCGSTQRYSMIWSRNTWRGAQRIGPIRLRGERQSFKANSLIRVSRTWATPATWQRPCNASFIAALRVLNSCPYQCHRQRMATPVLLSWQSSKPWRSICAVGGLLGICASLRSSMSIRPTRFLTRCWSYVQTRDRP